MTKNLEITGVAIFYNETLYTLPKPNRHHDVIRMIGGIYGNHIEGFVDSDGNFLNRRAAMKRAIATGQFKRPTNPKLYQGEDLFSEDLW